MAQAINESKVLKVTFSKKLPPIPARDDEQMIIKFYAEATTGPNPFTEKTPQHMLFECFRRENRYNHDLAQRTFAECFLTSLGIKNIIRREEQPRPTTLEQNWTEQHNGELTLIIEEEKNNEDKKDVMTLLSDALK